MSGIGLLNEKPLHASLKYWYAQEGDQVEVSVDGFVIDLVRDGLLIEVQTGNFAAIKSKLNRLIQNHPIRLLYPIVVEKWIVRSSSPGGGTVQRRKSPKKGRIEDLFCEMVSLPQLLLNQRFSLEVVMIQVEETRHYQSTQRRRRTGWTIVERRLLNVVGQQRFINSTDWLGLLPTSLESFTTADLATALDIRLELSQKMVYCLREGGLIQQSGRQGRSRLYSIASMVH